MRSMRDDHHRLRRTVGAGAPADPDTSYLNTRRCYEGSAAHMPDDDPVPAPASDDFDPGDFDDPPAPPAPAEPDDVVQAVADFVDDLVVGTDTTDNGNGEGEGR